MQKQSRGLRRPGEELVHCYGSAAARPDRALLDYFFLPPPAARPLLCAVDLPGGVPWGDPPPDDAAHAPGCALRQLCPGGALRRGGFHLQGFRCSASCFAWRA